MFAVKKTKCFKTNALRECSYLSTVIALIFLSAEPEFCCVIVVQACEPSTSLNMFESNWHCESALFIE